jgi:hypothetical protein
MLFKEIKRVWSHNDMNYIPKFRETFPELNKVSREEMCDRWCSLGIDFYTEEKTEVKGCIRLTLPFAVMLFVLMTIGLPFRFMVTGQWSYNLSDNCWILNWYRQLGLV